MTKRVLVVEDQEDLPAILRDLLTGSGYDVAETEDGRHGVAKEKSERLDMILMDIQLPVIDGYEATRQIKADPNCREHMQQGLKQFGDLIPPKYPSAHMMGTGTRAR
jgi:two-component system, cell cycle response regulator DivK